MTRHVARVLWGVSGLGCALAVPALTRPVLAQSATAAARQTETTPAKPAAGATEEVVVTAQHRRENAQTTPIALSVYSGQTLRNAGVSDLQRLTAMAPDVSFTQTAGKSMLTIRGISSRDTTEIGDPAITVDTDGFYLNRPYALSATLYDIDRIEILRGPQGTLNGRNAVGGAINIVTAKPTDRSTGYASFGYGNYNAVEGQAAVNVPISRQVQVRASFFSESRRGYRDVGAFGHADDANSKSGRVQVAFQPTERLHGLVTLEYDKLGGLGDAMQNIPFAYTPAGALITARPAGIDSRGFTLGTLPYRDVDEKQVRGNLVYDLDPVEITLLGGYDATAWHHSVDQTNPHTDPSVYAFVENQFPRTANAELRFTSHHAGRLQWQAGGFFFQEDSHLSSADEAPTPTGIDRYFGFLYRTVARSEAGYLQASYQLTHALKLTGGVRYTHDTKRETGSYGNLSAGTVYAYDQGRVSSSKPTFHAEIEDRLTPVNFVYAKFDTGYKAGGFNLGGGTYRPETIKSGEIGSKNRFLHRRLQLNLAAYYSEYTNQQVSNYTCLANGQPVQKTQNAGASRIYGVEGDLIYQLPEDSRFNVNLNYLHARYTDFLAIANPNDPSQSGNVQLKGSRPPQSPTWSLSAGLEHDWPLARGTLTARIQTKFQSESNFSFYNYEDTAQHPYTMSDFLLTWHSPRGHWMLTGYVKNLEDSVVFADAEESTYAASYAYEFYPPRTYGARLQYS